MILLTYDVAQAFRGPDGNFGFGIGSLIMLANVILLWCYALGCHSCRHITGGRLKNFSRHPVRYWIWTKVSWLNARHLQFAWITLGTLMLTDLYILLVASGPSPIRESSIDRTGSGYEHHSTIARGFHDPNI